MSGKKKVLLAGGITAGILICIYCGISIYFMSHFFHNTMINGVDFSMKTADEAERYFAGQIDGYALKVTPKEGGSEEISGSSISMKYKKSKELDKALKEQGAFLWPSMLWKDHKVKLSLGFEYDHKQLEEKIQALQCFQNEEKSDPESAKPEFDGDKFVVKPEVLGTKSRSGANEGKANTGSAGAGREIQPGERRLLSEAEVYCGFKEVAAACDTLNKYCGTSITYDMAPHKEVVDKALISTWLSWDENMNVTFHEDKVREYMNQFAAKYETLYGTRPLTTPWGKATEVSGGTYGWAINEAAEADALIASIKGW